VHRVGFILHFYFLCFTYNFIIYTVRHKKLHPSYWYNNFVKIMPYCDDFWHIDARENILSPACLTVFVKSKTETGCKGARLGAIFFASQCIYITALPTSAHQYRTIPKNIIKIKTGNQTCYITATMSVVDRQTT